MSGQKCPNCNADLRSADNGRIRICLSCEYQSDRDERPRELKIPGLDPGRQAVLVQEKEEPIMQRVITALRRAGCQVLSTVHRHTRHTCSSCGHNEWHRGQIGVSKGTPDLLVRRPSWPAGVWLGIETKGTSTPLSVEQKALEASCSIVVVRSVPEAIEAVRIAEEVIARQRGEQICGL